MLSLMCYANSVDVLDDGGIVRYGRVVDLADNGLFVDLLYPHQRREYFPFERLLLNPASSLLESPCPTEFARLPVEVLVPAMSVGALVWLAGEAVNLGGGQALGRYDGAIVHWVCPDGGGPCTDFLPLSRIRWPQTAALAAQRHVRSDTFGKRSLALDDAFPSLSAEEAAELIKRLNNDTLRDFHFPCDANVVELVERRLEYIYQPDLEESGRYDPRGLRYLVSLASFQAELIRLSALSDEIPATCDEVALPMKVWRQVFAHLDTVTQMGLRAVCGEWQRALDEPELSGRLWVGDYADSQRCFDHFRALATLYHRLQADTQDLVVQAYERHSPLAIQETMMLCQMVHYVAQHRRPGIRLRSLHLHHCQWDLQINGGAATRDAHAECVLHQADPAPLRDIGRRSGYQLEDWIAACGRLPAALAQRLDGEKRQCGDGPADHAPADGWATP
ncbi:uncharacterized protein LOC129596643 [Paramacrobiotus metropolitanus]|uniref:uncharacterized protein LOC129596643 n=1 Tax=Paramacrobiotus metropolitanus TaxID=2943436 RepID=UPI0024465576|nr:uncharacterized protein LOC129596643 [Paramacrobiotus metropolitanus]